MILALLACTGSSDSDAPPGYEFPAADARPAWHGPGGPTRSFAPGELFTACAHLPGPPEDLGHRNTVVPWRGHLVVPWAHELGRGGLSFWDVSDPCAPERVVDGFADAMRETHALGLVHLPEGDAHAGDYAVANGSRGLVFWDLSDPDAPREASTLVLDQVISLDSYARTAFSVYWQYPHVFLTATDNGLLVIDATDPSAPFEVARFQLDPILRMGNVMVLGDLLFVAAAGEKDAAVIDVADPLAPALIARFQPTSGDGVVREVYSGTMNGTRAYFARKDGGSGVIVYDLADPASPTYAGEVFEPEGGGGYVFLDEGRAFIGQTHRADVYDLRDLSAPAHVGRGDLTGDLDTLTPFGNVAILAVDDEGVPGEEMAVMPWDAAPDATPPVVLGIRPPDGATGVRPTVRVGVAFDEMIEPSSVFPGSITLHGPDGAVPGWAGAGETHGWFTPKAPLQAGATYTVAVRAGGVVDVNGNAVATAVTSTFTVGSP